MNWQHLFLGFSGRTGKRDFWIGFGALVAAGFVANLLPLVGAIVSVALIYPWTALLAKRLHDFGKSGWLVLVPAVPAAASAMLALYAALAMGNAATMGTAFAVAAIALPVSALALLVGLGFLLWAGLKDGDLGPNAHGDASPAVPFVA